MANLFDGNSILQLIDKLRAVFVGRDELVTGTAIANLNADMVDGLHAATSGANAHVLATDASGNISIGSVVASTAIGARVRHSVAQTTTPGVQLALAFNSEFFDTNAIHDNVTNNSRLTCKTAGIYHITGNIAYQHYAVDGVSITIRFNGTTDIAKVVNPANNIGTYRSVLHVSTDYSLAVNDYVELMAYQNSGANVTVDVTTGNWSPIFSMVRIA